jgi:hypothetical protein
MRCCEARLDRLYFETYSYILKLSIEPQILGTFTCKYHIPNAADPVEPSACTLTFARLFAPDIVIFDMFFSIDLERNTIVGDLSENRNILMMRSLLYKAINASCKEVTNFGQSTYQPWISANQPTSWKPSRNTNGPDLLVNKRGPFYQIQFEHPKLERFVV